MQDIYVFLKRLNLVEKNHHFYGKASRAFVDF